MSDITLDEDIHATEKARKFAERKATRVRALAGKILVSLVTPVSGTLVVTTIESKARDAVKAALVVDEEIKKYEGEIFDKMYDRMINLVSNGSNESR